MNHEGYGSLGQVLTVPQTLVVAHGVLVLDPLPTDVAASSGKCGVNPRQMLVEVRSPRDEFAAQLALQGLAGTAAHLYGGDRLVTFLRKGYKQKRHMMQLQTSCFITQYFYHCHASIVHSWQQKSIGLKFSKSQTGSDVRYSCHHNSSRFTFPIFAHSCRFSVLHSLQSITPRIY